jgi:hypothetical protein
MKDDPGANSKRGSGGSCVRGQQFGAGGSDRATPDSQGRFHSSTGFACENQNRHPGAAPAVAGVVPGAPAVRGRVAGGRAGLPPGAEVPGQADGPGMAQLRRQDAGRDAVQEAGDVERALPAPRGAEHGAADRRGEGEVGGERAAAEAENLKKEANPMKDRSEIKGAVFLAPWFPPAERRRSPRARRRPFAWLARHAGCVTRCRKASRWLAFVFRVGWHNTCVTSCASGAAGN